VRLSRSVLAFAAVLASATVIEAALPKPQLPPDSVSLTGQLLVASAAMKDPRFQRTVILIVRHSPSGAFGIAINRPAGQRPLAELLARFGEKEDLDGAVHVFAGGPVEPDLGFVVHTTDYKLAETGAINADLAFTAGPNILRDIGRKKGPLKALVAFGYAGWGPNQLEAELAHDAWFTITADSALIFDEGRDRVWDEAVARRPRAQ
jgi:putative transcriptional regulator